MATDPNSIGVRVRPNANEFINDLRRDLEARRYTFYVDVKARLADAEGEITRFAKAPKTPVELAVELRLKEARAALQELRLTEKSLSLELDLRTKEARAQLAELRVSEKALLLQLDLDAKQARLDLAELRLTEKSLAVDLDLDTRQARLDLAQLRVSEKSLAMELDLRTREARAQLAELRASEAAKAIELDVKGRTDELKLQLLEMRVSEAAKAIELGTRARTEEARLQLLELRLEQARNKIVIPVEPKVDRSAIKGIFDQFQKDLGAISGLGVGGRRAQATGALGALGISAIGEAAPIAVAGVSALANTIQTLAGAAAILPGAMGAAALSLITFKVGITDVGAALTAMTGVWDQTTTQLNTQSQAVVTAQNNVTNAAQAEAKAQEAVGDARRSATNDLRNETNELNRSHLNEAQAILNLQKTRDQLAKGGFKTATDRTQAVLNEKVAEQDLIDVREKNSQLQQKVADDRSKGVEGSDKVTNAQQNLTRAIEASTTAQQNLEKVLSGGAAGKYADALAKLGPNAAAFVRAVNSQKDAILGLEQAAQQPLFANLGPRFLAAFKNLEPSIRTGLAAVASGLNKNILQIFDSLSSPGGKSIIERIFGGTAKAQEALTHLIDPLIRGFGTLAAAGAEHLPKVIDIFTKLADRFATFIETADKNKLDEWMNKGIDALSNLADIGVDLVKIVGDLGNAFGGNLIKNIKDATDKFVAFLESPKGKQSLKDMVDQGIQSFHDLVGVLKDLAPIIPNLLRGAKEAFDTVKPILELLAKIAADLNKIPHLVELAFGAALLTKIGKPFWDVAIVGLDLILTKLGLIQKAVPAALAADAAAGAGGAAAVGAGGAAAAGAGGAAAGGGFRAAVSSGGVRGALRYGLNAVKPLSGPLAIATIAAPALIDTGTTAAQNQPNQAAIDTLNAQLPGGGTGPISGFHRDLGALNAMKALADQGDPTAKWIMAAAGPAVVNAPGTIGSNFIYPDPAAELEVTKRYVWAMTHPNQTGADFKPPTSYDVGGFTDWPQGLGKMAMLHGKEYIQPADTVSHYGVDAMQAIHEKRATVSLGAVPPDPMWPGPTKTPPPPWWVGPEDPGTRIMPRSPSNPGPDLKRPQDWARGAYKGFQGGGFFDPFKLSPWLPKIPVQGGDKSVASPLPPGAPAPGTPGGFWGPKAPPPAPLIGSVPGTGPAPGPPPADPNAASTDPNTPYSGPIGPSGSPINFTIPGIGINIPIGTTGTDSGWGPGGPPVGLGGGSDGFDIRNLGIGPGPPGSTPNDWTQKLIGSLSSFATGLGNIGLDFASSFFGLAPLSSSPYVQGASALGQHFIDSRTNSTQTQAPGSAESNAQANAQINAADTSPQNPADPNAVVGGPDTSHAGGPDTAAAPGPAAPSPGAPPFAPFDPTAHLGPHYWWPVASTTGAGSGQANALPNIISGSGGGAGFLGLHTSQSPQGGASGPLPGLNQEIWNNTQTGQKIGEAGGKPVGPGTDQPGYYRNDWSGHTGHVHTSFNTSPSGEFYGLPKGTDIRQGAAGFPSWVYALGARYGVEGSTYAGHQESSGYNRGIDWWPKGHSDMSGSSYTPVERAKLQAFATGIASQGGGPGVGGGASERGAALPVGNVVNLGNPQPPVQQTPQQAHSGWWSGNQLKPYAPSYASLPGIIAGSGGGQGFLGLHTSQAAQPQAQAPVFSGDKGQLKMLAYQLYRQAGFPPNEWSDFDWLVQKESGWSPTAQNPSSTAHGLGQFLNTTWASVGGSKTDDPVKQLQYMLTYLKQRPAYHGSPAAAHQFHLAHNWYDQGGWLMPGQTVAHNATPWPELILPPGPSASFAEGGYNWRHPLIEAAYKQGAVPPPPPGPSRGPDAKLEIPHPGPSQPAVPPPVQAPAALPPGVLPQLPPPGAGEPMPTSPASQAPTQPSGVAPQDIGTGPGAGAGEEHIHPALKKGIESGAAALGNIAGAALGAGGMGGLGGFATGAFKQGGKIIEGIANVASAFLVGSITSGTTQNPYGETQHGAKITGGTVIDHSTHNHGDVYTNNLDDYFRQLDIREAQKSQAMLGQYS